MTDRLAPYNADVALAPRPQFPVDPAAERRARALDARIVEQLGPVMATRVATSPESAVRRAAMMLAARDTDGSYTYVPGEVLYALAQWHASHRYPTLRSVTDHA